MTLKDEALKAVDDVPIGSLPMLIQFARFLKYLHQEEIKSGKKQNRKPIRRGGWVEGEIWMSDDFNDPLEFVSKDEMLVLEAMRTQKKAEAHEKTELQEAAV